MVKNTIGGKKGKMLAKKRTSMNDVHYPVSTDENMIYVCVTKIFGGGVFQVVDNDKNEYKAFLRGKMKGSNKRHNLVSMHSILLAGIRIDSSDKSIVDILFVYDTHQIQTLSLIPSLNIKHILLLHSGDHNIIDTQNSLFYYDFHTDTDTTWEKEKEKEKEEKDQEKDQEKEKEKEDFNFNLI
jgi:hypothetical protein